MKVIFVFILVHTVLFAKMISDFLDPSCRHVPLNVNYADAAFVIRMHEYKNIDDLKKSLSKYNLSIAEYRQFRKITPQLSTTFCSSIISPYLLTQILSHLSIYRYSLDVGLKSVLILEDNAQVVHDPIKLAEIIDKLDEKQLSWDMVYTDVDYHNEKTGNFIIPCITSVPENKMMIDELCSRIMLRYGAVSYLISESGMKKILNYFENYWDGIPYDQVLFNIPNLIIYGSNLDIITNKYTVEIDQESIKPDGLPIKNFYDMGSVFWIDPIKLLTYDRFDVMAKYIYAKYALEKYDTSWHVDLYRAHLSNWVQFYNTDPLKRVFEDFRLGFDCLLESFTVKYFDESCPIPINRYGLAFNGSHRIGASLALDIPVKVCVESKEDSPGMTAAVFKSKYLLEEKYLDFMAYEYAKLKKNTHVISLFPTGYELREKAEEILLKYGAIVYQKDLWLSGNGPLEFIRLIYTGEWWIGSYLDDFKHSRAKAKLCFPEKLQAWYPVRVYLYECSNPENARRAKEEIRGVYQKGNECIHINDTHEQTVIIAGSVFNHNSIEFMNRKKLNLHANFDVLLEKLKDFIAENNIDSETLCVDTGSVLSAYGLRDCIDMDVLHLNPLPPSSITYDIDSHNRHLHHHAKNLYEIICNPENHFFYQGIKFVSLDLVKQMKKDRGSEKDLRDIALIDSL